MATPVGRIEKEFLLKVLFEEKLPIMYIKDSHEYMLSLERPAGEKLYLRPDRPIGGLKTRAKMPLLLNYRGQAVDFTVEVLAQKDDLIICGTPKAFYKNLDRDYLRVDTPSDLKINLTFLGDRYKLAFPKVMEYENVTADDLAQRFVPRNISVLIKQIADNLKNFADEYKIVSFKDRKPETMEERIISETGKTLFIPSTDGFLPKTDPYPGKRIITEEIFKRYLETTGVGTALINDSYVRFIRRKSLDGIYADVWAPILFQEYVIGYIRIWISKEGRPPLDFSVLDQLYQFAKVFAFSLKENGYFEHGKMRNEPFEGKVLDISASGLLFACSLTAGLMAALLVDAELTVTIEAPNRTINAAAGIVRRFKDKSTGYFGCRFKNMAPEDTRFLFECLYGRQIDAADAVFLSGQV